jgi:phosphatidylserine/phosphatidylglycerophosphate/cardiolipin synthase-like enzyme
VRPFPALALLLLLVPRPDAVSVRFAPTGDERGLQKWIASELKSADKEIRVAVYTFTSMALADALGDARKRGVTVRVLVDANQHALESSKEVWARLKKDGVDVRRVALKADKDEDTPRFHHKYCVIDGRAVFTGSYNWTFHADRKNHENLVLIADAETAKAFSKAFDTVWSDTSLSQP